MVHRALWLAMALALSLGLAACDIVPQQKNLPTPTSQQRQQPPSPGRALSLTLDGARDREPELQAIAGYLRQIGVEAQVQIWEYSALVEQALAGNRDAYATDWGSATFTPVDLANPKLKSRDRGNFSHYSSQEVDTLLELAASITDNVAASNAYFRVQDVLFRDAPWIFGYYRDSLEAASDQVKGWRASTDNRINLHKVALEGGDTLVVALRSDRVQSLDPADYRDRETETVLRNLFDGLVTRSPEGIVKPEIAQSWTMPDPKSYIFELRRDVRFHNGDPLTADDVLFTFNRIMARDGVAGRQSPRLGLLGPLEKVEKVDDYTVKMTLGANFSAFLQLLVHTQIVPKKYYEGVGFEGFGRAPVGAGPFKFVSGQLHREVVMEQFEGYWNGPPPLKRAVFRLLPEASARIAALRAGVVHIINEVPPENVAELKSDPGIQVQRAPGTRLYQVELNNRNLTDPRVRRALNYAVDWEQILAGLYKGYAHRVSTALLPSGFGYNADLKPYPYDPEEARALLKQAGYSVR